MRVVQRNDTVSMDASFNGNALSIDHLNGYSVTIKVTDDAADLEGVLSLEGCNNAYLDTNSNNTPDPEAVWVPITGSNENVASTGVFMYNASETFYRAVRLVWARTAGTGELVARWYAKGPQS